MKGACPLFVSTRLISISKVLKWLKEKILKLMEHFKEKKTQCTLSLEWWIVVSFIQPLVEQVERIFITLQSKTTLVCEQKQLLSKPVYNLTQRIKMEEQCHLKKPKICLKLWKKIYCFNIFGKVLY